FSKPAHSFSFFKVAFGVHHLCYILLKKAAVFLVDCFGFTAKKELPFWLAELPFDSKVPYNSPALGVHGKESFGYQEPFFIKVFRNADYYYISQNLPA